MRNQVTPLVITYNEQDNIERTLLQLRWAQEVIVVDSFSTDGTLEILKRFPNVRLVQRVFDDFARQCQAGMEHVKTPWVLSLDADYVVPDELAEEIGQLDPNEGHHGYVVRFKLCVFGKPLRANLYPPRPVLFRKDCARYWQDGHAHRLELKGSTRLLKNFMLHDDRKPLAHWFWAQNRYAILEVAKLERTPADQLSWPDKLRKKILLAPWVMFLYTLLGKGLILDGWAGWFYVLQRTIAELALSLHLVEKKLLSVISKPKK